MEKSSSFERIVGKATEIGKKEILQKFGEMFDDQHFEELKGKEREKTAEESQIILLADEATNEIRQKYGLENFNIPLKNFHIITEEAWPEPKKIKADAIYNSMLQGVVIKEASERVVFMERIFHEMLHFKSYNALQMTTGENPELDEYRMGLIVNTRDGKITYFRNLNEAVTEEMTKKFAVKFFDNPLFAEELKQTKDFIEKYPKTISDSGKLLFNDDTFYVDIVPDKASGGEKWHLVANDFVYKNERKILNILIDKIFEKNPNKFQNKEEVFEIFAKGMITGNILPMGRLIDETFGKGALRRIGELDGDIQLQEEFVSSL